MSELTPARIACRQRLGQPLPTNGRTDQDAIASFERALRSRPAITTVLEACVLMKSSGPHVKCTPGDAAGWVDLTMLCKQRFGTGVTRENLNRLIGELALRPGWTGTQVNGLTLAKFVKAFTGCQQAGIATPVESLGDRNYRVGHQAVVVEGNEDEVMQAFARSASPKAKWIALTQHQLITFSGYESAPRILRRIAAKHSLLSPAISCPGKRGRGGFQILMMKPVKNRSR